MINYDMLNVLLNLRTEGEERFWVVFDWLKREFFVLLKAEITSIDWKGDWLKELERIYERVVAEWRQTERLLSRYDFQVKRLKGVLYEVLFYLSCVETSSVFKASWIMELAGDPLVPDEKPPWFEVIPIYDIIPRTFRIKVNNKWVVRTPQIEADFMICYWDEKGSLPLAFVDVKGNLKRVDPEKAIWNALGCRYFYNSILQIAHPETEYPRNLKEWEIKQVCWNCGALNKGVIECENCSTKIWIGEEELWNTYPIK